MKITDTAYYLGQTSNSSAKANMPDRADKDFNSILKSAVQSGDQERLYKACQELESVFLSKVFEAMRQTVPRSDLTGDSFALDTFESMLYDEYARISSQTKSMGLAEVMYRQLSDKLSAAPPQNETDGSGDSTGD